MASVLQIWVEEWSISDIETAKSEIEKMHNDILRFLGPKAVQ